MKIIGPEAVAAYLKLCPNDTLDDLSEQDLAEFEFNDEIQLSRITIHWDKMILHMGMAPSRAQARRLIEQNAVSIDTEKLDTIALTYPVPPDKNASFEVRVGKLQKRLIITP